jgi:hypothetical protein
MKVRTNLQNLSCKGASPMGGMGGMGGFFKNLFCPNEAML